MLRLLKSWVDCRIRAEPRLGWRWISSTERNAWNDVLSRVIYNKVIVRPTYISHLLLIVQSIVTYSPKQFSLMFPVKVLSNCWTAFGCICDKRDLFLKARIDSHSDVTSVSALKLRNSDPPNIPLKLAYTISHIVSSDTLHSIHFHTGCQLGQNFDASKLKKLEEYATFLICKHLL